MTARTHDLAAITAINLVVVTFPVPQMSLSTALASIGMCFIGGLAPDFDNSTSKFWEKVPAGSILGKLIDPLFAHRHISHSILGLVIFTLILNYFIKTDVIIFAFIIGYLSHLIMDTLTTEGVPWLFPIPYHIGFPPYKQYRVKTGKFVEKFVIFPSLFLLNAYFFVNYYHLYLAVFKSIIK